MEFRVWSRTHKPEIQETLQIPEKQTYQIFPLDPPACCLHNKLLLLIFRCASSLCSIHPSILSLPPHLPSLPSGLVFLRCSGTEQLLLILKSLISASDSQRHKSRKQCLLLETWSPFRCNAFSQREKKNNKNSIIVKSLRGNFLWCHALLVCGQLDTNSRSPLDGEAGVTLMRRDGARRPPAGR